MSSIQTFAFTSVIFLFVGGLFFAVRGSVSYQITQTDVQRFHDFAESRPRWFWETDTENFAIYETHHRDSITNNEYLATKGKPRYQVAEIDPLNEARWAAHNTQFEQHEPFQDFVCKYQAPNEEFHHIQVSGNQVFFNDNGKFSGYRGVGAIIAVSGTLKEHERSMQRLISALDVHPDRIAFCDADDRFIYSNKQF